VNNGNTPLKEPLRKLKTKLTTEAGMALPSKSVKSDKEKPDREMMFLNTDIKPQGLSIDNLDEYININETSLCKLRPRKLCLVFGTVANIQRAIDFALYPNMPQSFLSKAVLTAAQASRLGRQRRNIPNFWAYVGYVVIERISQDPGIGKLLLGDKEIFNMIVGKIPSYKGPLKTLKPIAIDSLYTGVVRAVVDVLRATRDSSAEDRISAFDKLIYDLKRVKDKSVFAEINVETDFM